MRTLLLAFTLTVLAACGEPPVTGDDDAADADVVLADAVAAPIDARPLEEIDASEYPAVCALSDEDLHDWAVETYGCHNGQVMVIECEEGRRTTWLGCGFSLPPDAGEEDDAGADGAGGDDATP